MAGSGGKDDLMVTPLLDLFVALIPFLILSAVMTKINIVDIGVSKPVSVIEKPKDSNFTLSLKVDKDEVAVVLNKKISTTIPLTSATWNELLHESLVEIKKVHPHEIEMKLEPKSEVSLDQIMTIMDSARKLNSKDEEIIRKDKKTGKPVRVKYLFPKITLRGVYT